MKKMLWNLTKLAFCGAVIAGIGALVLVTSPEGGVNEAEADLFWLTNHHRTGQEKFVDALDAVGLGNARAYDWNGNTVYFAFKETTDSPLEVSIQIQAEMVRAGLNQQIHTYAADPFSVVEPESPPEVKAHFLEAALDFFNGGLVPVEETDDYVALNGAELHEKVETLEDLILLSTRIGGDEGAVQRGVKATRFVEAFRTEGHPMTQVVAVYSQDNVDLTKFQPNGDGVRFLGEVREDIPACPGCTRSSRIAGTGEESDYLVLTFETTAGQRAVLDFYRRALPPRGWEPMPSAMLSEMMVDDGTIFDSDIEGEMAVYMRDGLMLSVHVYDSDEGHGTAVSIFQSR